MWTNVNFHQMPRKNVELHMSAFVDGTVRCGYCVFLAYFFPYRSLASGIVRPPMTYLATGTPLN